MQITHSVATQISLLVAVMLANHSNVHAIFNVGFFSN